MIKLTEEMKVAFRAAQEKRAAELVAEGAPLGAHDILDHGLTAVLAIVEREHAIETSKLRGALKLTGDSRNLWKQRAIDAGWTPVTPPDREAEDV